MRQLTLLASLVVASLGSWATTAAACPDWNYNGETLRYSADAVWTPRSHEVVAGGNDDLSDCPMPGEGYVAEAPDFTLDLSDNPRGLDLEFRVEGNCDTVLLVNDEAADWHFNDDDDGLDPRIRLRAAPEGVYDIWVGTLDPDTCPARLVLESFEGEGEGEGDGPDASGTGFVVNRDGWILTNDHVVDGCGEVEIPGHGRATRIVRDADEDLAAVRMAPAPDIRPLTFRARRPRLAEPVHALGFPLSDILSQSVRATSGTVNALTGLGGRESTFQISAPIQPGNSGGPLIDGAGLVIGVITATLSESAYDRAQNVNFAVPAAEAMRFLTEKGIAYEVSDGATASTGAGDISDRVEAAAAATVMIECQFGAAADTAEDTAADTGADTAAGQDGPEPAMIVQEGIDVIGFDYETTREASPESCQGTCEQDRQCRAFTFNRRHGVCFLKDDAALLAANDDAVGGYAGSLAESVLDSGFSVRSNADTPGGDYSRLHDTDFPLCMLECVAESRCLAFAYVRLTRDCWLKDRVGTVRPLSGVELGLR